MCRVFFLVAAGRATGFVRPFESMEVAVEGDVLQSELRNSTRYISRQFGVTDRLQEFGRGRRAVHFLRLLPSCGLRPVCFPKVGEAVVVCSFRCCGVYKERFS